jgi:hypothetical protein
MEPDPMYAFSRSFFLVTLGLVAGLTGGCATAADDSAQTASQLEAAVHVPADAERTAILSAFRAQVSTDLNGQVPEFNATDPVGRFEAHGDWAFFQGIIEGPNDNKTALDYKNSEYKDDFVGGFLAGVQRNGNFAAKFQALAHRAADGTWQLASFKNPGAAAARPTYALGVNYDVWRDWVSLPTPDLRDIFVAYPHDDLHAPQAEESTALTAALTAQVSQDLHGQTVAFNTTDPVGTFLVHDGWAYLSGIVVGPNDNAQALDYRNSIYSQAGSAFQGVLHNNNFAASVHALFKQEADGTWHIHASTGKNPSKGYAVGSSDWVGNPESQFAYDIFGNNGNGNGNGNGDGGGDGDGDGSH